MKSVKIVRDGQEAEVIASDLHLFLQDGWEEVEKKQSEADRKKQYEQEQKEAEEARAEEEAALGRKKLEAEQAEKAAHARIEAELREKEERQQLEPQLAEDARIEQEKVDHRQKVQAMEDKNEIADYIKENFDTELDKRGSVESVKEKALKVIDESGRTDS